CVIMMISFW
nr:immunoglobulin heavy chain junction region [Macaca mulatta]